MFAVVDVARTIAFYGDVLGFQCKASFGDPEPVWCHLVKDDIEIMFNRPPAEEMAELSARARDFHILYFYPDDVSGLYEEIASKGHAVSDLRTTAYGMTEFELRDPDGIWLWFGGASSAPSMARD
jgi:uncharacterized glyoxalase superfamily protein PhnB